MFMSMIKDPVVWGSLLLIFVVIVMMGYYTWLFMHNSAAQDK